MIYVDNTSEYPQTVYIPRDEEFGDVTGHTVVTLQRKDFEIMENGVTTIRPDTGFDGISGGTISVYVNAATGVTFEHLDATDDGVYVATGDTVFTGVTVQVYDRAYQDGYLEGEEAQKARLGTLSATTNGHYSNEDGYKDVYIDVEGGGGDYEQGYHDGMEDQKALLTSATFTRSGYYEREDGWNTVEVRYNLGNFSTGITENGNYVYQPPQGYNGWDAIEIDVAVPQNTGGTLVTSALTATTNGNYYPAQHGCDAFSEVKVDIDLQEVYNEGYTAGTEAQKSLLSNLSATTNGTYTSETGYSAVTVDVETGQAVLTGVTITTNNTVTTPDQGIDGFDRVEVAIDTTPYYNEGYGDGYGDGKSEGYSSGVTDGRQAQKNLLATTVLTENGVYQRENGWNQVEVALPLVDVYIDANGTYSASTQNAVGFRTVEVNVPTVQPQIVTCTQAEYDALNPPDPTIIYLIKD